MPKSLANEHIIADNCRSQTLNPVPSVQKGLYQPIPGGTLGRWAIAGL